MVLAEMVDEFDLEQPEPGRETTAFIKRWKRKELAVEHKSSTHLTIAMRGINHAEIQNIRETKKWRDEQREKLKRGQRKAGRIGRQTTARQRDTRGRFVRFRRKAIRDGTFAVEIK